jgi:hypothetical protein
VNEFVEYAVNVVAIPAVVGTLAAVPVLVGPLRRRPAMVEGVVAVSIATAFLLSFGRELDANAILRQFATIPNDTQAIERWHRLAFAAIVLGIAAPVVAAARGLVRPGGRPVVTALAAVLAAASAGLLVQFPRATVEGQVWQGALCVLATLGFARFSREAAVWAAWVSFGVLAVLALEGGFASLAVMSGALSAASFGIGSADAVGGWLARRGTPAAGGPSAEPGSPVRWPEGLAGSGALALVLGTMVALVARCGQAYDQQEIPAWAWTLAPLLPFAGVAFGDFARRTPSRARTVFWRALGTMLLGAALLAVLLLARAATNDESPSDASDPMDGIYGAVPGAENSAVSVS